MSLFSSRRATAQSGLETESSSTLLQPKRNDPSAQKILPNGPFAGKDAWKGKTFAPGTEPTMLLPHQVPADPKVIAGPFVMFDGGFVLEFLEPNPLLHASGLIRATYKASHHLIRTGDQHPQSPPFHLHFDQTESFCVLAGTVICRTGYARTDHVCTQADGIVTLPPWFPHTFFPDPDMTEDSTLMIWAHPDDTPRAMDMPFWRGILSYTSDVYEGKASFDLVQTMMIQHATGSADIWWSRSWWLGSLRWRIPYLFQATLANYGRIMGKFDIIERYMDAEEMVVFKAHLLGAGTVKKDQ